MSSTAKKPSQPEAVQCIRAPVVVVQEGTSAAVTRPRRTPSKNKLTSPATTREDQRKSRPSRPRVTPSRPQIAVWTNLLVEAGVIDSIAQLGTRVFRGEGSEGSGLLGLSLSGRGRTAVDAASILAGHLELHSVEVMASADADLIVVLADSLGPRRGTVTCDIVIPRPLWEVTDACRTASRNAAATSIPVMTLRRSALGESGTLLSVLIAPEDADPPYDVACATAQMVDVLREV
ncbi:MAG: hypothetical protein HYY06_28950 [Deltaproteobacteria bacterium]|nr:hypothetical protein [Deltaproteobacteria bacterium]